MANNYNKEEYELKVEFEDAEMPSNELEPALYDEQSHNKHSSKYIYLIETYFHIFSI